MMCHRHFLLLSQRGGFESPWQAFADNGGHSRAKKSEFKQGINGIKWLQDELCSMILILDRKRLLNTHGISTNQDYGHLQKK